VDGERYESLCQRHDNKAMIALAHQRLDELCRHAEKDRLHGTVQLIVTFRDGRAVNISRRIDGREGHA